MSLIHSSQRNLYNLIEYIVEFLWKKGYNVLHKAGE